MTTLRDLYDMAIGVDTLIPAGRTPRWIADKFGLVVPETPDPPGLIRAADRLHENASRLREVIESWHQALLAVSGAAHPTVMAATVILAQQEWIAFAASVTAYRKQREFYAKLGQAGANQLALLEARRLSGFSLVAEPNARLITHLMESADITLCGKRVDSKWRPVGPAAEISGCGECRKQASRRP